MSVAAEPLTADAFRPYGQVVAACPGAAGGGGGSANQGTASRFDRLATLRNGRPGVAGANVCVFRSAPRALEPPPRPRPPPTPPAGASAVGAGTFRVRLLERHAHSSQMFVPMRARAPWLVVVALPRPVARGVDARAAGAAPPDRATLRAFLCRADQGVNFRAGVWHHPLIALGDAPVDFACVVFEDGTADDCHVVEMGPGEEVLVRVPLPTLTAKTETSSTGGAPRRSKL